MERNIRKLISPDSYGTADNMLSSQVRTSVTSMGIHGLSSWKDPNCTYSIIQINLGNNFIAKLEIVSALNSFNLGRYCYHFNYINTPEKYNPKVYLSAVQSAAIAWEYDNQDPQKVDPKWVSTGEEKSGSWPRKFMQSINCFIVNILYV